MNIIKSYISWDRQMDNQSPLAMQFKEFDADADGKLNPD